MTYKLFNEIRENNPLASDAIHVFDFDGVISDKLEDDIYSLPPVEGEDALLDQLSDKLNIKCDGMDVRYRRHLLYQAALYELSIPILEGPAFSLAKKIASQRPSFFLTARAGWHATKRLRQFCESKELIPTEIFQVGRTKKNNQLLLITDEFPQAEVFFYEDSLSHLENAMEIGLDRLELIYVERKKPKLTDLELRETLERVFERIL